jgi:polygalacturonase
MKMKKYLISGILVLIFSTAGLTRGSHPAVLYSDIPFEMPEIKVPVFQADTFSITDYDANGNGQQINSNAFAMAIENCTKNGGVVNVPRGIWLTGPIKMKSNVNLHLESGAVILFTTEFEDYPVIKNTWEGSEEFRCIAPVSGFDLENIAITGEGIIDGSGQAWRPVKKFKTTSNQWRQLTDSGGAISEDGKEWWPSEAALNGRSLVNKLKNNPNSSAKDYAAAREYLRPVMINFVRCKNILLDGPTFQNSPAWNIHPLMCENLIVRNVTVRNPWFSQNGDGIDIESCKNVLVYNNSFDVGDDAICIKSGKNEYGRKRNIPSENIIISNNIVYHGHGGFTVGSEMSGGVRNILVKDCTFLGTDVGLRFKSTRGRGGIVENIFIENIYMKDIPMEALRFNMFYENKAPIPEDGEEQTPIFVETPSVPVDEGTPIFRNINIKNIFCRGAGQAVLMQGLPEMPLSDLRMENLNISAKQGIVCVDVDHITMKNLNIMTDMTSMLALFNSQNILIENARVEKEKTNIISVAGSRSREIRIKDPVGNINLDMITMSKDLDRKIVKIE